MSESFPYLIVAGAYLVGAIPFGVLFARAGGVHDLRQRGSGNIGATNVLRTAGKKAAVLTLLADALKGYLPVLLARLMGFDETIVALAATAALAGHIFPVYLKFKGGKGVATGFGVVLAFLPQVAGAVLVTWLLTVAIFRYSSLAAVTACVALPLFTLYFQPTPVACVFSLLAGSMILYRHKDNIQRLLKGAEKKIGEKG